ncbi:DeoR/GlpR family DNA-binding transcription regulator [Xanthocytophaga flava]|uniref:DeoR/GlpR family DNA-binding transcription regulator n=1 Tax=Xanthocytophaga flava TaxID=3048013 RepID=UPI0028D06AE6|nr:DeoR/GlpR family DNA-binding transcription regulator [Xanthocytophaga flavus]MDJ1470852.1 DeoR/GlpR family DNA-binding transcription regulator [Xanthocytophaga flavus]
MLKEERHQHILSELNIRNRILLTDIAQKLQVSEDTIRRDLKELHEEGKLKKVHGGAVAKSFNPFSFREEEIYDRANKLLIAEKACTLIKDGQAILITGGTTNLELISLLPKNLRCTFFTPSLPVAMQLAQFPTIETILIGGKLSPDAMVTTGGEAFNLLNRLKVDLCFLGTGHLDVNFGLSEFDWEIVELKQALIRSSCKIISLTLSAKINSIQRYKVCDLSAIHMLITELDPFDEKLTPFRMSGLTIL